MELSCKIDEEYIFSEFRSIEAVLQLDQISLQFRRYSHAPLQALLLSQHSAHALIKMAPLVFRQIVQLLCLDG